MLKTIEFSDVEDTIRKLSSYLKNIIMDKIDSHISLWERFLFEGCRDIVDSEIEKRKKRMLSLKRHLERKIEKLFSGDVQKFLDYFFKESFDPRYSPILIPYPKHNNEGYCVTNAVMYIALAEMLDYDLFSKLKVIECTKYPYSHIQL